MEKKHPVFMDGYMSYQVVSTFAIVHRSDKTRPKDFREKNITHSICFLEDFGSYTGHERHMRSGRTLSTQAAAPSD